MFINFFPYFFISTSTFFEIIFCVVLFLIYPSTFFSSLLMPCCSLYRFFFFLYGHFRFTKKLLKNEMKSREKKQRTARYLRTKCVFAYDYKVAERSPSQEHFRSLYTLIRNNPKIPNKARLCAIYEIIRLSSRSSRRI